MKTRFEVNGFRITRTEHREFDGTLMVASWCLERNAVHLGHWWPLSKWFESPFCVEASELNPHRIGELIKFIETYERLNQS